MSLASFIPEEKRHVLKSMKNFFEDLKKGKLNITEWKGFKYPPGFSNETVKYFCEKYNGFKNDDIMLVSYLKTGRTWTHEIISQIFEAENPGCSRKEIFPIPFHSIELGPETKFEVFDLLPRGRRLLETHITSEIFPVERALKAGVKIIYILRNPKDQTVSWYHFSRTLPFSEEIMESLYPDDWGEFIKVYFSGHQPTCLKEGEWYPEHILSWYKYKDERNVKFLYYEDMKKNTVKEIQGLADFLEVNLSNKDAKNIADRCSFDAMKTREETKRNSQNMVGLDTLNLFRKGQVGNWKEYFTVAQSEAIDEEFQRKLSHTDIKFTYQL